MSSCNLAIQFGNHAMQLDVSGALYWPTQRLLVVSDMHLEKSTFLAGHGSIIPPYDTLDTLDRLDDLLQRYTPRELILLGDSFHDAQAWTRLEERARQRITALSQRVEQCSWLEGNHDVALFSSHLPNMLSHRELDGILFSHEPVASSLPQIIGHYHPTTTLRLQGRHLRGKCFAQDERLLVMPSFGSYTGGLNIQDPAFVALMPNPRALHLIYGTTIRTLSPL